MLFACPWRAARRLTLSIVVEQRLVQVDVVLQVGTDVTNVYVTSAVVESRADICRLDEDKWVALPDDVTDRDGDLLDNAADLGLEHVLHLHRVHDDRVLASDDSVALADEDLDDGSLDRRAQRFGTRRSDDLGGRESGAILFQTAVDIEGGRAGALTKKSSAASGSVT